MENVSEDSHTLLSFIQSVLPNLSNQGLNSVVDTIKNLGIETAEDIKYIKEEQLLTVLKPVQARKVISSFTVTCRYILFIFLIV